jgi:hypothetical protein
MEITVPKAPLTAPVSKADAPGYAANLRRARLASTGDSALEYYDFVVSVTTLATTCLTPETQGRDLTRIQDALVDTRAGVAAER